MNQAYPPAPPPYAPPQVSRNDEDQLDLLGILFYVYSALVGLSALMCFGAALVGLAFMPMAAQKGARHEPEPWIFGAAFLVLFGAAALFLAAKAVVLILAGRACRARSGYVMPMVGACFSLVNIPLGTALGVYGLIVLMRPGVKARLSGG